MRPPINEEGREMAAQLQRGNVDSKAGMQHPLVPVVLPTVGQCPQSVAQHAVGLLDLCSGVLVVSGTHYQRRTNSLGELADELRGELGIVVNDLHIGNTIARQYRMVEECLGSHGRVVCQLGLCSVHLAGQKVYNDHELIETGSCDWETTDPVNS